MSVISPVAQRLSVSFASLGIGVAAAFLVAFLLAAVTIVPYGGGTFPVIFAALTYLVPATIGIVPQFLWTVLIGPRLSWLMMPVGLFIVVYVLYRHSIFKSSTDGVSGESLLQTVFSWSEGMRFEILSMLLANLAFALAMYFWAKRLSSRQPKHPPDPMA